MGVVKSVTSYFKRSRGRSFLKKSPSRKSNKSLPAGKENERDGLDLLVKAQVSRHVAAGADGSPVQISSYWLKAICAASDVWFQDARYLRVADALFGAAFPCFDAQIQMARTIHGQLVRLLDAACENLNAKEPLLAPNSLVGRGIFRSATPSPCTIALSSRLRRCCVKRLQSNRFGTSPVTFWGGQRAEVWIYQS